MSKFYLKVRAATIELLLKKEKRESLEGLRISDDSTHITYGVRQRGHCNIYCWKLDSPYWMHDEPIVPILTLRNKTL